MKHKRIVGVIFCCLLAVCLTACIGVPQGNPGNDNLDGENAPANYSSANGWQSNDEVDGSNKLNNNDDVNIGQTEEDIKIDADKDWVFEAEGSFSEKIYQEAEYGNPEWAYDTFDIKIPYININSADAQSANEFLLGLLQGALDEHEESLAWAKKELEFSIGCDHFVSYDWSLHNNILSLCVREEIAGTDVPQVSYNIYNFNIATGKSFTQEELINALNLKTEDLDAAVKQAAEEHARQYTHYGDDQKEFTAKNINDTIQEYKNNKEHGQLNLYLNPTGELYLHWSVFHYMVGSESSEDLLLLDF